MKQLTRLAFASGLIAMSWAVTAAPPTQVVTDRACAYAAKNLNVLVDFTKTVCIAPTLGAKTLIFAADRAVYDDQAIRKPYLLTLVAAAGDAVNKFPNAKIVDIGFMDPDLGLRRQYWTIPAADAARLQLEIASDRITLDQFFKAVTAASKVVDMPAKK